jgi:hypothetical protein
MTSYAWEAKFANGSLDPNFAHDRDPRQFRTGAFAADDQGVGMFYWANSAHELVTVIKHVEPFAGELEEKEAARFRQAVDSLLDGVNESDQLLTDGSREQLNSLLQGLEVRWWGTFDELVGSGTEFARELRDVFRSGEDDEGVDDGDLERPIPSERLADFVEFLAAYGY